MPAHVTQIVKHDNHRPARLVPLQHHAQQILCGALVHGSEGLVEQDYGCVLQQQAAKEGALEFADGQAFDKSIKQALESSACGRLRHAIEDGTRRTAERAKAAPGTERDEFATLTGKVRSISTC